jgi:hypothetical protein
VSPTRRALRLALAALAVAFGIGFGIGLWLRCAMERPSRLIGANTTRRDRLALLPVDVQSERPSLRLGAKAVESAENRRLQGRPMTPTAAKAP